MANGKKTGGRKKGSKNIISADIRYLAQTYGHTAIEVLFGLLTNSKQDAIKVAAARELLDRGYGKPAQTEAIKDDDQPNIGPVINIYRGQ